MSRRATFLFGLALGAWLNIWPALFGDWWAFRFAYLLVALALVSMVYDRGFQRGR